MANGLYLIATTNKTPLRNRNCPITDPITEMGVAHFKYQSIFQFTNTFIFLVFMAKDSSLGLFTREQLILRKAYDMLTLKCLPI